MVSRFLIAGDEHEEESSSESESEGEEVTSEEEGAEEAEQDAVGEAEEGAGGASSRAGTTPRSTIQQRKISIKLGANVCHVSRHPCWGPYLEYCHSATTCYRAHSCHACPAPPPCV